MKKILFQLASFFSILVALVIILSTTGLVVVLGIPVEESTIGDTRYILLILCSLMPIAAVYIGIYAVRAVAKKIQWYESLLDSIPFPISVTDVDMNWTFINRPVEQMLNVKREAMLGKHCSNWGAGICKTENCEIGRASCRERV